MQPSGLVERDSGLLVPPALARAAERPISETVDADGRARIVLTNDERKLLRRAIVLLEDKGFAVVLRCQNRDLQVARHGQAKTIKARFGACGDFLRPEDGPDAGTGCRCARIHLRAGDE